MKTHFIFICLLLLLPITLIAAPDITLTPEEVLQKIAQGENYQQQNNYDLAEKEFKEVLITSTDTLTQAIAATNLGINYYLSGSNANENDTKKLLTKLQEKNLPATSNENQKKHHLNEPIALSLLKYANELIKPLQKPKLSAVINHYLGLVYIQLKKPDDAIKSFDRAFKDAELAKENSLKLKIQIAKSTLNTNNVEQLKLLSDLRKTVSELANYNPLEKSKLLLAISEKLLKISTDKLADNQKQQLFENTFQTLKEAYLLTKQPPQQTEITSYFLNLYYSHVETIGYLVNLYKQPYVNENNVTWLNKQISDAKSSYESSNQKDKDTLACLDIDKTINSTQQLNEIALECLNFAIKEVDIFKEKNSSTDTKSLEAKNIKFETVDYLLMKLELQRADLLYKNGNDAQALQAYKLAAQSLTKARYIIPITLENSESSLQKFIDPIYRGLADVSLLLAQKEKDKEKIHVLRNQAIDAMEKIKETELEDFFKDRCLLEESDKEAVINLKTEKLDSDVAIIYPIILKDRFELLFRTSDTPNFEQKTIKNVSAVNVIDTVSNLIDFLQTKEEYEQDDETYKGATNKLYSWLLDIEINNKTLKEKGINNIIYVPDGVLRKIPFAALFSEKNKYAIQDYSVVTLPGLSLKKINSSKNKDLLIGALSIPNGPSIKDIMDFFVSNDDSRGLHKASNNCVEGSKKYNDCMICNDTSLSFETREQACVKNYTLNGVDSEVKSLKEMRHNDNDNTLTGNNFTHEKLENELKEGNYSNVHIASHGWFGENAEESFILLYDELLHLNEIQSLLLNENIKNKPIDLLTLSACNTAQGNDRALLGFSGIAIKNNVASAIGALWPVSDTATAQFMKIFYDNLTYFPKAEALRKAQLAFINDPIKADNGKTYHYNKPYYWSPFILVGHW